MNNLKSGGTLFLAYKGRMGRANILEKNKSQEVALATHKITIA